MAITYGGVGSVSSTNGSAPAPGLPSGMTAGVSLMVCVFYSREVTDGTVSISAGWNQIANERSSGGLLASWWRVFQTGDSAPTLSLTGHATGTPGDTAHAHIGYWNGCATTSPVQDTGTISTNASQQNIGAIAGITTGAADCVVIAHGGKGDNWTSVATLSGDITWAEISEPSSTSGADSGMVWDYGLSNGGVTIAAKTFAVSGGSLSYGKGMLFSLKAAPVTAQGALVNVNLAAPAATAEAGAVAAGALSGFTLSAPQGTAAVQSPVIATGALAGTTVAAPEGVAEAGALASGSVPGTTLAAPAASATAGAIASGSVPGMTLAAPQGKVQPVAVGSLVDLELAAPVGTAAVGTPAPIASGALSGVSMAAPSGAAMAGSLATGALQDIDLAAPAGTAAAGARAVGVLGSISLAAPAGAASAGVPEPVASGALAGVTLAAPSAAAVAGALATGALSGVVLAAPAGSATASGITATAVPFADGLELVGAGASARVGSRERAAGWVATPRTQPWATRPTFWND